MRKYIIKIINFLDMELPWWLCWILGILLMAVPSLSLASKGITSLEPGFSCGVLYGIGLCYSISGLLSSFQKKKSSAR